MSSDDGVAALRAEAERQRREGTPFADHSVFLHEMGRGLLFGECADCGCQLERPFWDTICFACQDERDELEDEMYEDEEDDYGA